MKHVGPFANQSASISFDNSKEPSVLIIQCSDEHLVPQQNSMNGNQGRQTPLVNGVLDVVKNELKLDHFYIAQTKMILVKIDVTTLDNSVLNDY